MANVLIFPDITSGNIAFKLVQQLGRAEVIGPILTGMNKPVNILEREVDVNQIVNIASLSILQAKSEEDNINSIWAL